MTPISNKYCVNCESVIDTNSAEWQDSNHADFCSELCAQEYAANCDPELLARAAEINPDALPIKDSLLSNPRAITGHPASALDGTLPPATLAAVQSILNIGAVSKHEIAQAIKTNSQNDTIAGNESD
jgi:hypothetical protein